MYYCVGFVEVVVFGQLGVGQYVQWGVDCDCQIVYYCVVEEGVGEVVFLYGGWGYFGEQVQVDFGQVFGGQCLQNLVEEEQVEQCGQVGYQQCDYVDDVVVQVQWLCGGWGDGGYQLFFLWVRCISMRWVMVSIMKVMMKSMKLSSSSVEWQVLVVLLKLLVISVVMVVLGLSSEGDRCMLLLIMKVIVIVLFRVCFRLRKMLLIIVEWVQGSMMF